MRLPRNIRDNLSFLLAETRAQLSSLRVLLETHSPLVAQRLLDRYGYTYNLKMRIHDGCTDILRSGKPRNADILSLRAAESMASDLDRLTDLCRDCVKLTQRVDRKNVFKRHGTLDLLQQIERGIDLVEEAITSEDTQAVLKIGEIAQQLDSAYQRLFARQMKNLKQQKHPQNTVIALFVAQLIEEMGDVLQDSAEAIMSAQLGQPMHLDRFRSLKSALADLGLDKAAVETIAETRSGSGIAGIAANDNDGYLAIFKDGSKAKLKEERDSVESWHEIYPGLAPQILSWNKKGKNAGLLIEHLPGQTFEQVLLHGSDKELDKTVKLLTHTLQAVWTETRNRQQVSAEHMSQLRRRLPSVLEVHPGYALAQESICGVKRASIDDLITRAEKIEKQLPPPFSVYIHGDFNVDNIIFDGEAGQIRFIDLHRSRYLDYVQDIAVFMVSNYRLQVLDQPTRERIKRVDLAIYQFARRFARKQQDGSFDLRLALGLARSFITSTRFILDRALAKRLFLRGVYLLERCCATDAGKASQFRLPVKELFS